jgi:hypothetical protein
MAPLERETKVAMENIAKSGRRTYDDVMEAQREKREALIEDEDRPSMLRVVETIEPIDIKACPGFSLAHGYLA